MECRLLQRPIKVQLLSAPVSLGAVPFATAAPGVLPPPQAAGSGIIIGNAWVVQVSITGVLLMVLVSTLTAILPNSWRLLV